MTTDDPTPDMEKILNVLLDDEDGRVEIEDVAKKVNLKIQETKYFMEKLESRGLVEFGMFDSGLGKSQYCTLTATGRTYVMEKSRE